MTQPIEPVAQVSSVFNLVYVGSGPISAIAERHNLKVGDVLYTASALEAAKQEGRREGLEEAAKRIESHKRGTLNDCVMQAFADDVRALSSKEAEHG